MAGWAITIAGIDRTTKLRDIRRIEVRYVLGSGATMRCELLDRQANTATAYRPAVDQAVVLTHNGAAKFTGTILKVDDSALGEPNIGVVTKIEAADVQRTLSQRLLNVTYAAGQTLKQNVTALRNTYLAVYGITLDAAMADGPTMAVQPMSFVTAQAALTHWSTVTGWVHRVLPTSVLEMFSAGSKTAAYSLTSTNATIRGGVTWSKQRGKYVNRYWIRYGPTAQLEVTDPFTGSSAQTSYALTYPLVSHRGYITVDGVFVPIGTGTNWTLTPSALEAVVAPANGAVIVVVYTVQFPQTVMVEDAAEVTANGPFEDLIDAPDVVDKVAATAIGTGFLRRDKTIPRKLTIRTWQGLELPGTTFTITVPERTISGSWLITETVIRDLLNNGIAYDYVCLEGVEAQDSWVDFWRGLMGGTIGSAGSITVAGSPPPPGVPVPLVAGRTVYFLGGGSTEWVQSSAPTWVAASAVQVIVDTVARGTVVATVVGRVRAIAGSVTARLQNVTDNVTVGTSAAMTSVTFTPVSFAVTLTAGSRTYELQVLPSLADTDVAAVGYLE